MLSGGACFNYADDPIKSQSVLQCSTQRTVWVISGEKESKTAPQSVFLSKNKILCVCVAFFICICLSHLHAFRLWGPQLFLCCKIFSSKSGCETLIVSKRRQQQILDYINCDVTLCECESAVVWGNVVWEWSLRKCECESVRVWCNVVWEWSLR